MVIARSLILAPHSQEILATALQLVLFSLISTSKTPLLFPTDDKSIKSKVVFSLVTTVQFDLLEQKLDTLLTRLPRCNADLYISRNNRNATFSIERK